MKIFIFDKAKYDKRFIYRYLKQYILDQVTKLYSPIKCKRIMLNIKLNVLDIFVFAINNLNITETSDSYIFSINKNLRYNKYNLYKLINYISYGTRDIKGYRLLYIIFEEVANTIDLIYEGWLKMWQ